MSINTFVADEREMGEYTRIVDQMRGNNGFLSNDEEVAEEVLTLEA